MTFLRWGGMPAAFAITAVGRRPCYARRIGASRSAPPRKRKSHALIGGCVSLRVLLMIHSGRKYRSKAPSHECLVCISLGLMHANARFIALIPAESGNPQRKRMGVQ